MANTLTGLIQTLYSAIDVVSRELVGFIPAVTHDPALTQGGDIRRAALNQTVTVPITPARSAADSTPGTDAPDTGDVTQGTASISISKSRHVPIRYTGEEMQALMNNNTFASIFRDDVTQAMRTLVNEIETDIGSLYTYASRAFGTAGTAPFNSAGVLTHSAGVARILEENGAKGQDLQLVLGSAAWANLRGVQSVLFKVNEAGTDQMLREGMADRLHGFALRHTGGEASHTKGTATGYDLNGGEPAGETTIVVDGSDSGTILAGDAIAWTGYTGYGYYVVSPTGTQTASGAAGGNIVINAPGLMEAIPTTTEGTTQANYTANLAFARSAIVLATRAPALPQGGDAAADTMMIADPVSGLAFEIAEYKEYLRSHFQVRIAWGYAAIKPEHIAILLG